MPYFKARIFGGHELPQSKSALNIYFAAASALAVQSSRYAVVEDAVTGVAAGLAAGGDGFDYSPPEALAGGGADGVVTEMRQLPILLDE